MRIPKPIPKILVLPALLLAWSPDTAGAQVAACPDWKDAHTRFVEAKPADNLISIVQNAASGTTILLNPGTYKLQGTLQFLKDDVTMRSKSGNRDDVILDGNKGGATLQASNFVGEIIAVAANNITLADFTVRYAMYHAVHAYPPGARNIAFLRMRNLHIHDAAEQQIKINSNGGSPAYWVDQGILECSLIEFLNNSVMESSGSGYYTGGMDVHGGENWIVRANLFRNIEKGGALMEHAVHFWSKSRGTLIENNRFENNFRAIGLGMKTAADGIVRSYPDGVGNSPYFDHIGGIVRNNVIWNKKGTHMEVGIEIMNVLDAEVYNNTVVSGDAPFSGIEYRWPNTSITVKNNLLSHNLNPRDGAKAATGTNVENAGTAVFKDGTNGDLHLTDKATAEIDKGTQLPAGKADLDFEGKTRGTKPDIGAYEMGGTAPVRPKAPGKAYAPAKKSGARYSSMLFGTPSMENAGEMRLIDGTKAVLH